MTNMLDDRKKIDLGAVSFKRPDFGFNDSISFDEESPDFSSSRFWRKFLDTVSPFPQYERVHNYIGFIQEKKLEAKRKQRKATPQ